MRRRLPVGLGWAAIGAAAAGFRATIRSTDHIRDAAWPVADAAQSPANAVE